MVDEATMLVAQLAEYGIRHIRTAESWPEAVPPLSPQALITALARQPDPRMREALIPLFLRHPEYAKHVPALEKNLDQAAVDVLRHLYTAAVYLQRLWHSTLGIYLGDFPALPNYFGESVYGLAPVDESFGEEGLRQLAQLMEDRTGYEWLSAYQSVLDLFLEQLELDRGPA